MSLTQKLLDLFKSEATVKQKLDGVISHVKERDPEQKEFHQAVEEIVETLLPYCEKNPDTVRVLAKMLEPERVVTFRVPWLDRDGNERINRGYRVQFNSAIGPYKGGLRFHPSVTLSVLKFLAVEQVLKNSLTTLAMGGGKGGSDFDPKGRTDAEVNAFCISFMTELAKHIGQHVDVPAGDIGVGGREIGYMFGQYKRITNQFEGVLTGKGPTFGGSNIRPEATGYGAVYFLDNMLEANEKKLDGMRALVSGSGNVAQYAVQKLLEKGVTVLTVSDSDGTIYEKDGIDDERWQYLCELKNEKRGRLSEWKFDSGKYFKGKRPWQLDVGGDKVELALPCATQNELDDADAKALLSKGVVAVVEGANMPSTPEAIDTLKAAKVLFGPAKAANAGGVAVSGLEMSQNSQRLQWTRDEVDEKLKEIMKEIFDACADAAKEYAESDIDYQAGANIAGFQKVAQAMKMQGAV